MCINLRGPIDASRIQYYNRYKFIRIDILKYKISHVNSLNRFRRTVFINDANKNNNHEQIDKTSKGS